MVRDVVVKPKLGNRRGRTSHTARPDGTRTASSRPAPHDSQQSDLRRRHHGLASGRNDRAGVLVHGDPVADRASPRAVLPTHNWSSTGGTAGWWKRGSHRVLRIPFGTCRSGPAFTIASAVAWPSSSSGSCGRKSTSDSNASSWRASRSGQRRRSCTGTRGSMFNSPAGHRDTRRRLANAGMWHGRVGNGVVGEGRRNEFRVRRCCVARRVLRIGRARSRRRRRSICGIGARRSPV